MNNLHAKLGKHANDSLKVPGDFISTSAGDGDLLSKLVAVANLRSKTIKAIVNFKGLPPPGPKDQNIPGRNVVTAEAYRENEASVKSIVRRRAGNFENLQFVEDFDTTDSIAFALIEDRQYEPTKNILEKLWPKMSYGATLFFPRYDPGSRHSCHLAITEFINRMAKDVSVSRQMMVGGQRESFIAVKCFNRKIEPIPELRPKEETITVACVLKTGGDVYDFNYVNNLLAAVRRNSTCKAELVCLTDKATGITQADRIIKLQHDFPGWWSKMELFKPDQFQTDRVVYFDLDTLIVDNIDNIIRYDGDFAGLRDFYSLHSLGSGVLGWECGKFDFIFDNFNKQASKIIANYREGDQRFIEEQVVNLEYFQDVYPRSIVSFKRHCIAGTYSPNSKINVPQDASIVCFHGNPRIHTISADPIKSCWDHKLNN